MMRGMIVCLVVMAGCTTTAQPPAAPAVVTPTAVTPAVAPASAGANPVPIAGGVANVAPTAGVSAAANVARSGGASAAANVAPSAGASAAANAAPTDASGRPVSRSLLAQGYQPSNYHGQLVYCRKEKLTGSQFTHKVCLTEQEAAIQERIAQDEMMKRGSQGKCVPPLCPNH
jgi:hypothetical protein